MSRKASLVLAFSVMIAAGWAVVAALDWPWKARLFPLAIGIPLFGLAAAEALWGLFGAPARAAAMDYRLSTDQPPRETVRRTLQAVGWMLGLFGAIVLLGFPLAVPLFALLYLRLQAREGWVLSLVFTLVLWALFYGIFDRLLHLPFPAGWIQTWAGLT